MRRLDVDLRDLVGAHILDQGTRPTCVTIAASAAHEAARTQSGIEPQHLSPEAIWAYCYHLGTATIDGMLLADAGPALSTDGQPPLELWPYECTPGHIIMPRPMTAGNPPWHRATLSSIDVAHDGIESSLEDSLSAGIPVILVLEVTDEFLLPGEDGIIGVPNIRARHGGYHAVACIGAATHPTLGRLLLVKNSWGDEWGAGGYGWLSIDYLRAFAAEAAVVQTTEKGNHG